METPGKGQFQAGVPIAQAAGVNVAANNPVTAAIGNAANAVENVGNLAEALQKEQERQFLAEAELKMSKASADLQLELVGNSNPQDHVRLATEKFDSIKADILSNEHYSPRFQREMEQRLNLFTNQKLERITLDARLAQIENGKRLQSALIQQDISSGNFEGARQRTKELKGTYASDEDVQIGLMSIDQVEKNQQLQLDVKTDPKGTAERLADESNYPELSPLARQKAKEAADDQAESYRKDEMDKIEERIVTGDFTGADLEAGLGHLGAEAVGDHLEMIATGGAVGQHRKRLARRRLRRPRPALAHLDPDLHRSNNLFIKQSQTHTYIAFLFFLFIRPSRT
jgi:hypothetical protein